MLKQIEVSDQCMLEVFVNGCLYIPVPLSIQMRIRDYISFVLFCACSGLSPVAANSKANKMVLFSF